MHHVGMCYISPFRTAKNQSKFTFKRQIYALSCSLCLATSELVSFYKIVLNMPRFSLPGYSKKLPRPRRGKLKVTPVMAGTAEACSPFMVVRDFLAYLRELERRTWGMLISIHDFIISFIPTYHGYFFNIRKR